MTDAPVTSQQWLDSHQYTTNSIKAYERVFGEDFVSPGGAQLSLELLASLNLAPGQRVLDVGCGLGGSAFLMASRYGAIVTGIDLSENMLTLAREKLVRHGLSSLVRLELRDCLTLTENDHYDALYSRDVFLHIADKPLLFDRLHRALKPGGRLLFTDYACGPRPWHPGFSDYIATRGYHLHTHDEYAGYIEQAGFEDVVVEDWTERFTVYLRQDLLTIGSLDIGQNDREALAHSWEQKLERARGGDHRWLKASARAASRT